MAPAPGSRLLVKVTWVVCPVGRRIVRPGYVPPYVHMFVHGPSRIWMHAASMLTDTLASPLAGGTNNGCEKGVVEGVGVGVITAVAVAVEVAVGVGGGLTVPAGVGVGLGVENVY